MPRYVALLRGVSPQNASMPALARCVEAAGFTAVKTLLASGNVAFTARAGSEAALARKLEAAIAADLGREFPVFLRAQSALQALVAADPFATLRLPAEAKRIVTFLREAPPAGFRLPPAAEGVAIHALRGREVFTSYLPNPRGPVFMNILEKTFGKAQTTRTWDTVKRCAEA